MHRKSVYILFLAVLGLLALGIVILFRTLACLQDTTTTTFTISSADTRFGSDWG